MSVSRRLLAAVAPAAASSWTPASLSGLVAWFDASDGSTITASGGNVTEWRDKSGNARHLANAGTGPATGSRTLNSLNVLDFPFFRVLTRASVTVSQPYTVAWAGAYDSTFGPSDATVAISLGETSAYAAYAAISQWRMFNGTVLGGGTANSSAHCWVSIANGSSSSVRIDGSAQATGNAGTGNGSRINLGAASSTATASFDGYIGEVVISTGALSGTDLTNLESYLKTKWGTP